MKKLSVSGLMLAAFLVGCAAAMVAAPIIVPPVRAGTTPTKWEYKCEEIQLKRSFATETTKVANQYGAEGWEMITVTSMYMAPKVFTSMCFKRPLP